MSGASRGARDRFALGGGVGVVFDVNRLERNLCLQAVGDGEVQEGQVVGVFYHAGRAIGGSGSGDAGIADVLKGQTGLFDQITAELRHILDNGLGVARCVGGNAALLDDFISVFGVYDTGGDVGSAQINANVVHNVFSLK